MATSRDRFLSHSINGRGILVAATTAPGTLVHTTSIPSEVEDEVWLYASNTDTSDHYLTIELGGITVPDDQIILPVSSKAGLVLIIPGLRLSGDDTDPVSIKAFADIANKINIFGYVNRKRYTND